LAEVQFEHAGGAGFFSAASSPHSGDWLFAMPVSSCGLRDWTTKQYESESVCSLAGLIFCVPHQCHCGASVSALDLHGFVCKKAAEGPARHHALNDLVVRAVASEGIPASKKRQSLSRSDGKRLDGFLLSLGHSLGTSPLCARWPIRTLPQQPEKQQKLTESTPPKQKAFDIRRASA